jgi:hypothetical protein
MDVEELDEDEVVDLYEYIIDREPSYATIQEQYVETIWEESDDGAEARADIDKGIRDAQRHDNLLTSTISVFLPERTVHTETGWKFLAAEPLSELNERNPDLIIGNPGRNLAVIVECKGGLSRPGRALTQLYDAADTVREYQEELETNIGMEIHDFECVICVPSTADFRIAREIERQERESDDAGEDGDDDGEELQVARERVFVWRLHYLMDGEQLDLFTKIDTRSPGEETHDNQLAQVLQGGVDITMDEQATPSFYPSSHLYRVIEEVFSTVLTMREASDDPLRHFAGDEVLDILTDQRHLPHYDANRIGARMHSELIDRLLDFDLITPIDADDTELDGDGDFYRYRGRGQSRGTILNELCEGYKEAAVEWEIELEAMRRTIGQFDDDQYRLGEF